MNNREEPKKKIDDFIRYSGMAFEMAAIMGICTWIGVKIDQWLELSFPVFTLVFLVISVIGAIYRVIRKLL